MPKDRYYVSVQSRSIMREQGATPYEFEIDATEANVEELEELFDQKWKVEESSLVRGVSPGIQYHADPENDEHDEWLQQIYKKIFQLGTAETKNHIAGMGLTGMEQSLNDHM